MNRVVIAAVTAGLFAGVLAGTSYAKKPPPGNSGAAKSCQKGGYKNLFRADGTGFRNTGQCVSYAAHGGTFATKCPVGSWSATGVTPCALADIGFYVDTVGATAETACPVGTTTLATGSTDASACVAVGPPTSFRS